MNVLTRPRKAHRRRWGVALLAAIFLVAHSVTGPTSAQAATVAQALSVCPSGAACIWDNNDYTSGSYNIYGKLHLYYYIGDLGAYSYAQVYPPINAKNTASSVVNNGNTDDLFAFDRTWKTGNGFVLPKKLGVSLTATNGGALNNNLESLYFGSCLDGVCG